MEIATLGITGILFILIGLLLYFIPTFIAFKKQRDNKNSIFALNLLLGWSIVGWVFALIWALKEA